MLHQSLVAQVAQGGLLRLDSKFRVLPARKICCRACVVSFRSHNCWRQAYLQQDPFELPHLREWAADPQEEPMPGFMF